MRILEGRKKSSVTLYARAITQVRDQPMECVCVLGAGGGGGGGGGAEGLRRHSLTLDSSTPTLRRTSPWDPATESMSAKRSGPTSSEKWNNIPPSPPSSSLPQREAWLLKQQTSTNVWLPCLP